ncbi:MAG: hypothetical protein ACE141_01690 [Bryobacteraceae bacterium]
MRRLILVLAIALIGVATASADGLCTDNYGVNVLTPGFFCELGGLTFSNFSASQIGLGSAPIIAIAAGISGHETGVSGSTINLFFQTNFNVVTDQFRDITFAYTVTGGIVGIDGWMGGSGVRNISEIAYEDEGHTQQIGSLLLTSATPQDSVWFEGISSPAYIVKDITLQTGATMSEFTQSFHTPEPLTFGLIGSGLLLLGLLRRKTH